MRSVSESAFSHRSGEYGAEEYMRPQRSGGARIQLIIAILGMGTLGYMLWTIAKMLEVVPG
ncbi:MAG: hypothetical protein ACLFWF_07415 [Alphaproteobacteria bacterium]